VTQTEYNIKAFNSRRSPVFARRGMIDPHPLASLAGMRMLLAGGAVTAVAAAAVLGVVEPYQTGLGGDASALLYLAGPPRCSSMRAARHRDGYARGFPCPRTQRCRATVRSAGRCGASTADANAGRAWLLRRGRRSRRSNMPKAVSLAPGDAHSFKSTGAAARDPEAARTMLIDGRVPRRDVLVQPDLARTLRLVADGGCDAFYEGRSLATCSLCTRGGRIADCNDLAAYRAEWQQPIASTTKASTLECPPTARSGGADCAEGRRPC
jgi:gamma-glutamyltranspeptidase/glutathione hydrolase